MGHHGTHPFFFGGEKFWWEFLENNSVLFRLVAINDLYFNGLKLSRNEKSNRRWFDLKCGCIYIACETSGRRQLVWESPRALNMYSSYLWRLLHGITKRARLAKR